MEKNTIEPSFVERAPAYKARVEAVILDFIQQQSLQGVLGEAIGYAVATDGKRIRPLLAYATAELFGLPPTIADYPAAAIELVHTYSLVHDDLPAMDDDDLRRGEPTVHRKYDEATGILVGDALLTFAFELLSRAPVEAATIVTWVNQLATAAGARGMIAGQSTDLEGESRALPLEALATMHRQKSGALIEASLAMVAACSSDEDGAAQLTGFGHHIGLAFQIRDDLLDVEGTTEELGKPQGSDLVNNKSTFVSLLGAAAAREKMTESLSAAHQQLAYFYADKGKFGQRAEGLQWIADYIVSRSR